MVLNSFGVWRMRKYRRCIESRADREHYERIVVPNNVNPSQEDAGAKGNCCVSGKGVNTADNVWMYGRYKGHWHPGENQS